MKTKYLVIILALIIIGGLLFFVYMHHPSHRIYDPFVISEAEEIELYNGQFKEFEGQRATIGTARVLIAKVISKNYNGMSNSVKIEYIPVSGDIIEATDEQQLLMVMRKKINVKYRYNIEITGYTSEGRINKITIEEVEIGT